MPSSVSRSVEGEESAVDYLLERWYEPQGCEWRGCHPRDLIEVVVDSARFGGGKAMVTPETLDDIRHTCFLAE
jgi:hypothetical protein